MERLLQHSPEAQTTVVGGNGETALICAALEGNAKFVELLLQHSPEKQVAVVDAGGGTA